jgi:hypothetical protein
MKGGWTEVARIGTQGERFPHVLVDAHGWCLRLGPVRRDEKYYSGLPTLLQGLVEHLTRRHLRDRGPLTCAAAMLAEVRAALDQAARCGTTLAAAMRNQSSIRPLEPSSPPASGPDLFSPTEAA